MDCKQLSRKGKSLGLLATVRLVPLSEAEALWPSGADSGMTTQLSFGLNLSHQMKLPAFIPFPSSRRGLCYPANPSCSLLSPPSSGSHTHSLSLTVDPLFTALGQAVFFIVLWVLSPKAA